MIGFLCGLIAVLLSLYYYYTSNYDHWKKHNIPGPKPMVLFGNLKQIFFREASMSDVTKKLYDQFKHEPVLGIYEGTTPTLIVNDLDLVKNVLVKDFHLFVNRGFPNNKRVEPLSEHLFNLEFERWKPLRMNLSPVFTSGKLKNMFPLIIGCTEQLEKQVEMLAEKGEPVECRELAAKFTTDVIGSCAFGIDTSALSSENSTFREMGRRFFEVSTRTTIRTVLRQFLPRVYNLIGHAVQPEGVTEFFTKMVVDTMKYRRENNIYRPDFINMLMDLQQHPEQLKSVELTDTLLTAQAFVFFFAGFETSSITISHALYELAQNHDVQDKLREEIKEHDRQHGKISTYDGIKRMKYLDKVFKETLRKYPIVPILSREATENYTFEGINVTIPKGTKIWIPTYGIHRDPNIYPNPEIFDPERFSDEALASRHPMSYLAFGDGPRNCIGARFAYHQVKLGIVTVIRNHKVDVCEKTTIPYKAEPQLLLLSLQGGVHLKITRM